MSIILFIIILAVLIFVHELGHFIVAKRSGIRVDEFGLGFPPRLWSKKRGETTYSINAIPFGGFVKIFGENPDDESIGGPDSKRSFVNKPRSIQAAVLAAGVFFNFVFAWLLISIGFMFGLPTPADYGGSVPVQDAKLIVTSVSSESPASEVGLQPGDRILFVESSKGSLQDETLTVPNVQELIAESVNEEITLLYRRGNENQLVRIEPEVGIVEGRAAIGVGMDRIGILKLPAHKAIWSGAVATVNLTKAISVGLADFFTGLFRGTSSIGQVTGPVGIVGLVGQVSELGFIYILSFTAFISINLAVINLIPFPALDGGRLLFVLIEAIKGSPINPKIANILNGVGFALLIILMLLVTYNDILKLITN
ncbi:MAG: RIP metalloprotease RseP [bacterium]|nr:RIP metalloprotease RseP [bacterium]